MDRVVLDQVFDGLIGVELVPRIILSRRRRYREFHLAIIEAEIAHTAQDFALTAGTRRKQHGCDRRAQRRALR